MCIRDSIIGGHKKPEKVTRSHCYGRFIGRKSPQNTLFLTFFLSRMQNTIFGWTSPDNTNTIKNSSKKNINIHVHSLNFHAKLKSWIIKTEIWKIFEKKMKSPIKNWVFWEFGKIWMLRALPGIKWIPLLAAIRIDDNYT